MKEGKIHKFKLYEDEYKNTKRHKKYKNNKFWCLNCDAQLIGKWKKCPVCGYENGGKESKNKR